jgi:hypothetical protein
MPRVSAEEALYPRSQSEAICSLGGAGATNSSRVASTPDYKRSQRARYKVEALFAELQQQIKLRKARLRRLWNVAEQFYLAATAQNLKKLVRHFTQKQSPDLSSL